MSTPAPGRRSARRSRRVDVTTVLAVVLPLLVSAALFLVQTPDEQKTSAPPTRTPLTRATVICPSGEGDVAVTTAADGVRGTVLVGEDEVQVASGEVTTADGGPDPVAVTGADETAPGLVAGRLDEGAAASCRPPSSTSWFAGVGSGAGHRSVLELTNPDSGTAVADVTVHGRSGVVDAPRLRGISVPGGTTVQLDLATIVPRRDELSLQVVAARGRIGATLLDRIEPIGRGATVTDWLPAQAEPATENLLLGIAADADRRTLVVANGGDDEALASVRIVTEESVFTPRDVPELRIPPQSTARLVVGGDLAQQLADGGVGLLVTATEPVSTTLRSYGEGDLSHAVPATTLSGPATVVVPEGDKRLVLGGAMSAGVVEVVARSASGEELLSRRVEIVADRGFTLELPAGAALVTATPARSRVSGVVVATEGGTSVVPLAEPATNGLVPSVRPGSS